MTKAKKKPLKRGKKPGNRHSILYPRVQTVNRDWIRLMAKKVKGIDQAKISEALIVDSLLSMCRRKVGVKLMQKLVHGA